jgi:hypothetical protein
MVFGEGGGHGGAGDTWLLVVLVPLPFGLAQPAAAITAKASSAHVFLLFFIFSAVFDFAFLTYFLTKFNLNFFA